MLNAYIYLLLLSVSTLGKCEGGHENIEILHTPIMAKMSAKTHHFARVRALNRHLPIIHPETKSPMTEDTVLEIPPEYPDVEARLR